MSTAKYKALVTLTKDYRIPLDILKNKTGITDLEVLELVEETGGRHYRMLGFVPPSELGAGSVQDFYRSLEKAGLAKRDLNADGCCVGSTDLTEQAALLSICIPGFGPTWRAWDPEILDLL